MLRIAVSRSGKRHRFRKGGHRDRGFDRNRFGRRRSLSVIAGRAAGCGLVDHLPAGPCVTAGRGPAGFDDAPKNCGKRGPGVVDQCKRQWINGRAPGADELGTFTSSKSKGCRRRSGRHAIIVGLRVFPEVREEIVDAMVAALSKQSNGSCRGSGRGPGARGRPWFRRRKRGFSLFARAGSADGLRCRALAAGCGRSMIPRHSPAGRWGGMAVRARRIGAELRRSAPGEQLMIHRHRVAE